MGQAIYEGIRSYSLNEGPRICASDDRDVVIWEERAKLTCTEKDLEVNYNLLREVLINLLPYGEALPQHHFQVGIYIWFLIWNYSINNMGPIKLMRVLMQLYMCIYKYPLQMTHPC